MILFNLKQPLCSPYNNWNSAKDTFTQHAAQTEPLTTSNHFTITTFSTHTRLLRKGTNAKLDFWDFEDRY